MPRPINRTERLRLARELAIGAPLAGLLWLLLLRAILGAWVFGFPLAVVGFSLLLALLATAPDPAGTLACRAWRALVGAIDWVVTRLVCALLYYGLFTPIGLLLRLFGVRLVRLQPDRSAATCWHTPAPPNGPRRHFFRQY